ncbi:MAG: T9SS type A sorting domain-containing protein, partial [Flavobacterium sp.]
LLDPTYSNSVDEFDAKKITNQDETIAMLVDGASLSYQSRNMPTIGESIPLTHTQYRTTNYMYKAEITGNISVTPFIFDSFNNTYSELNSNGTTLVPFTVNPPIAGSIASDRFSIVFNQILNTGETAFNNSITVYPNPISNNLINISVPDVGDYQISIMTLFGQKILSTKLSSESSNTLHLDTNSKLATGIYFIQISNGEYLATKKIIVK